jgi:CelD/BcsL family acetyltransferase involved in cellulose biosynthesis
MPWPKRPATAGALISEYARLEVYKKNPMAIASLTADHVQSETLDSYAAYWQGRNNGLLWPSPFALPPWLASWWPHFSGDYTLYLHSVHHAGGLAGLAPLMRRDRQARLVGDTAVCDNLDFVVAARRVEAFYQGLLDHLAAEGIRRLVLEPVREDASIMTHLLPMAEKWGARVHSTPKDQLFAMPLPDRWEVYLQGLSGKERHEIRRKLRRLEEAGRVGLRCIRRAAEIPQAMEAFFTLFEANRPSKAAFMTDTMRTFFQSLATNLAAVDMLRLYFLDLDDRPIAASMCFDHDGAVYLYNNGYDASFRSLSPGLLGKVLTIRESVRRGCRVYDFLKGAEAYKKRLGGRPVDLYRCVLELR